MFQFTLEGDIFTLQDYLSSIGKEDLTFEPLDPPEQDRYHECACRPVPNREGGVLDTCPVHYNCLRSLLFKRVQFTHPQVLSDPRLDGMKFHASFLPSTVLTRP